MRPNALVAFFASLTEIEAGTTSVPVHCTTTRGSSALRSVALYGDSVTLKYSVGTMISAPWPAAAMSACTALSSCACAVAAACSPAGPNAVASPGQFHLVYSMSSKAM
ncbi:hypothetical protein NB723_004037 [Xanthomonas sacchari]|nr:hypothetical protein [Xanthomonas sacchari]